MTTVLRSPQYATDIRNLLLDPILIEVSLDLRTTIGYHRGTCDVSAAEALPVLRANPALATPLMQRYHEYGGTVPAHIGGVREALIALFEGQASRPGGWNPAVDGLD